MDAERYAQVRDLFLAVDELPESRQLEFLISQCGDDQDLIQEVLSLLREHNADSARVEGQSAKPPAFPNGGSESTAGGSHSAATGTRTPAGLSDTQTGDLDPGSASTANAPFLPSARQDLSADASNELAPSQRRRNPGRQNPGRQNPGRQNSGRQNSGKQRQGHPNQGNPATPAAGRPRGERANRGSRSSQVTQHGAQRTHASPRYADEPARPQKPPSTGVWQSKAKRYRRTNSGWLWLAAILPTALIGWWTYTQVSASLREAAANELAGVADSVRISVSRFLDDQSQLAESWSRAPELRAAIVALSKINENDATAEVLRTAEPANDIRSHLITLSQREDIKYVVWDRTGKIIASWLKDGADIGENVAPDGAANLARAMRGETVLFGPEILRQDVTGFTPETDQPVMAEIMPIADDNGKVVATMLVRSFGMYENFDQIFREASGTGGLDVYAVDGDGVMVTNSPAAISSLADGQLSPACRLRVSDPGRESSDPTIVFANRRTQPLTYAVAGASTGMSGSKLDSYRNYAGIDVIGAWRWIDDWELGIVVERTAGSAFATARIVQFGFVTLALMLTITALVAASQIAKRTALAQAAIHPLSRYELLAELGSGGMGVVYRARHAQLGRDTALKVLRGDRDNLEERLRFDREAKLAASLSNPHTVTIYDYGRSEEGEAYCVMEFLKGITLYDVVARSGYQPIGRVLFILRQICDSLGEAHKLGLVHRDVKPQNVMLSLDAAVGDWAVVFDFGLAKPLQPDADSYQTAETIWAGTPMYMAPERYREPNKIDPRSDIYSVGCIAYFLLSGRPPFIECDPESLFALVLTEQPISIDVHRDEEVPEEITLLVKQCMAKNVNDRFSTVNELALEIDRLISGYPWSVEQARSWWRVHGEEIR